MTAIVKVTDSARPCCCHCINAREGLTSGVVMIAPSYLIQLVHAAERESLSRDSQFYRAL